MLIPGIIQQIDSVSPEAMKAQKMAELKNLAEWRSRRLQQYKDWSDPVKRAARIAQANADLEESKKIYAVQESLRDLKLKEPTKPTFTLREIQKPKPKKRKWYDPFGWFS